MPYKTNAPKILEAINNSNHILLVSHEKPDGDTLGSSLALAHYLHHKNKKHKHFCAEKPAEYFYFLPHIENITNNQDEINLAEHDLVIALDCGDIKRTRLENDLINPENNLTIINIDHHASNDEFGHYNLVVPKASSTSEIIYNFFAYHNIEIDKYMATCLLTGILTDTMNFTNGATTQESLKIASQLLNYGARINQIINKISQTKNLVSLKLWGEILSRLEYNKEYNFAYTIITQADIKKHNITTEEASDGLANFLSNIDNVDFIMVLTEESDGKIKGNLRTTKNNVDVAKLAQILGGGGHQKAAGFTLKGKLTPTSSGWQVE